MVKVSVITPVWNQMDHTLRYLYLNRERQAEFIIIDNGSTDQTPQLLADWAKPYGNRLKVITNDRNLGFPIACNQGAEVASGDILLFLNNDVMIYGDYLRPLQGMNVNTIAGPELWTTDTGWNRFGGTLIAYISGWCLAITQATFSKLGRFDERYSPCDYEDMDLCHALTQTGGVLEWLQLPIQHISGQTGTQLANRHEITETNRRKFAEKWGL